MLPGCRFPPLPDFQSHFLAFPHRRQSPDMWIPGSPESQLRNDGPFPRQCCHHVAVCQQETLAFIELHQPGAHDPSLAPLSDPWQRAWAGSRMGTSDNVEDRERCEWHEPSPAATPGAETDNVPANAKPITAPPSAPFSETLEDRERREWHEPSPAATPGAETDNVPANAKPITAPPSAPFSDTLEDRERREWHEPSPAATPGAETDNVPANAKPITAPPSSPFSETLACVEDEDFPRYQRSCSLDLGVCQPEPSTPQRRISQGSYKEKSVRRKIRVYSPKTLRHDSLSSRSLDCQYLDPGPSLSEDLGAVAPDLLSSPCLFAPPGGQGDSQPRPSPDPPYTGQGRSKVVMDPGGRGLLENPLPQPGSDQERRRFSASELISRLQLSQRKSSFTMKLGKSLSARVASRDRQVPRSLSPSNKPGSRDRSSAESSDSAPISPMGPGPQLPSADSNMSLHRGGSKFSTRKDSIEEGMCAPTSHTCTKRLSPSHLSVRKDSIEEGVCAPTSHTCTKRLSPSHLSVRKDSIEEGVCAPTSLTCTKRLSRFLSNLILYQEYSDVAINREIQRQQGADPGAEEEGTGEEGTGEVTPPDNLSPTSSFCSLRGSAFNLWQDIPDVRTSGTLDSFSNEERKLQEAKFELVTSEASYIRSLAIAVDHFMLSRELSECLGAQDRQWLFSKLPDVKEVSERFLQALEQRLEEDILRFDVCDIVLAHCPALRRVYLPYVTNQAYQEQTYQRLLQENARFSSILARLEEDPICQRLSLTSFLILPFQRITRLKMLVENILKRTTPGSRDEDTATKAFNELKKLIKECNSSVQSMKRTEELIHLNKKIHFEGKIFPLISQSRWLVKHGELLEVDTQTMSISGSKLKLPTRAVYLHLCNDCLLLSRRKDAWKFAVFAHAKIGELKVKDLSQTLQDISGHLFHLQLCEGQLLKHQVLLKARTESERQRWITAMVPSDQDTNAGQMSENGDLSQVQCIKSYQAQENDELTLEKADVLQAKTITSDGWVEGIRLSDGERGWFPKAYVEEITSRSARRRNLRENNRIKCATQKLEEEFL